MIKIFCDRCEDDITIDDKYKLSILVLSDEIYRKDKRAIKDMILCGKCKEFLKEILYESGGSDT